MGCGIVFRVVIFVVIFGLFSFLVGVVDCCIVGVDLFLVVVVDLVILVDYLEFFVVVCLVILVDYLVLFYFFLFLEVFFLVVVWGEEVVG